MMSLKTSLPAALFLAAVLPVIAAFALGYATPASSSGFQIETRK